VPLTVSCFSKIQIGFTFLVPAHPDNPGQSPEGRKMCVCVIFRTCCHENNLSRSSVRWVLFDVKVLSSGEAREQRASDGHRESPGHEER